MIFISKNLELLRKKAGLKQSDLAEKLSVKPNTISNYEKGVSQPDYVVISKLMDLFEVTSDQLLFSDLSSNDTSRNLKREEVTESVFDKFLAKIDERDRKIDDKESKIEALQSELLSAKEELAAFKARYPESPTAHPEGLGSSETAPHAHSHPHSPTSEHYHGGSLPPHQENQ